MARSIPSLGSLRLVVFLVLVSNIKTAVLAAASPSSTADKHEHHRPRRRLNSGESVSSDVNGAGSGSLQQAMDTVHGWFNRNHSELLPTPAVETTMDPQEHPMYGRPVHVAGQQQQQQQGAPGDYYDVGNNNIASIVGGGSALLNDAPWQVILLQWSSDQGEWVFRGCGGTLISQRHVLTAGHCVDDRDDYVAMGWDAVYVRAFEPFLDNGGEPYHFSPVASYELHTDFRRNVRDAAVITLQIPANLSEFPVINLAPTGYQISNGVMLQVFGFGQLHEDITSQPDTLQTVDVPYISGPSCQQFYGELIGQDMLCAGYSAGGSDACGGDSGGPLVHRGVDGTYQIGIVSWGDGCARPESPGVYTSIPFLFTWIRNFVCGHDEVMTDPTLALCQTTSPTLNPTDMPTATPSLQPTHSPTMYPAVAPMAMVQSGASSPMEPSPGPSFLPTRFPSTTPTFFPTMACVAEDTGCTLSGPPCCIGQCVQWFDSSSDIAYICTAENNFPGDDALDDMSEASITGGMMGMQKKPMIMSTFRDGNTANIMQGGQGKSSKSKGSKKKRRRKV